VESNIHSSQQEIEKLRQKLEMQKKAADTTATAEKTRDNETISQLTFQLEQAKQQVEQLKLDLENQNANTRENKQIASLQAQIQELKNEIENFDKYMEEVKATHKMQLEEKDNGLTKLVNGQLQALKSKHDQEVKELKQHLDDLKAAHDAKLGENGVKLAELSGQLQALQAKREREIQEHRNQLENISKEKKDLASELNDIQMSNQEQVEIATAAVRAAEKRERSLREEMEGKDRQLKQVWLQVKLLQKLTEYTAKEYADAVSDAQRFQVVAERAQDRIEDLEDELVKARLKGFRKRLGGLLSRKR
jgi:hypothetical protein